MRSVQLSIAADGCLEARSKAVGQTYWPEARSDLHDGIFHTSDLAEIVFDLVYLRGRASDQINMAGRKVSPEVIENALAAHPAVRECLVFGVPSADPERGETIVACLAAKTDLSVEILEQFLTATLPAW